jgi:GTPase KRas protein
MIFIAELLKEDHYRKNVVVDGKNLMVFVLDTAGQEGFETIREGWIRGSQGQIVIFSLTSKITLGKAEEIMKEIQQIKRLDGQPAIVLCGNKCDLKEERQVTKEEAEEMAAKYGAKFIEASAREKINNDEIFLECIRSLMSFEKAKAPKEEKKKGFCTIL